MLDELRQSATKPRFRNIIEAVVDGIARRSLAPGQRLPPQRELAHDLGIATATVGRAYTELEAQGFVTSHVGRGTYIANRETQVREFAPEAGGPIDMAVYRVPVPPLDEHFGATLKAIIADHHPETIFGASPTAGLLSHRRAMAHWLAQYGVDAHPDRIVLTNGGQHATMVALSTLTHPGQVIATEELTDPRMKAVASYLDRRLVGVSADAQGMLPDALDQICRSQPISAIYCTPRHHNPTNATLPLDRREAIVAIARRYDLPIVESDLYGTLSTHPDPPIVSLAPERTHFVSSLGRIAGPGVKVGCLVSPKADVMRTQSGVGMSTGAATLIAAEIAARWIMDDRIRSMVAWQQADNLRRVSVAAAFPLLGGARSSPESPHIWLDLPDPWRAEEFVDAAAAHGISIAPSHSFVVGRRSIPHAVRLVIGAPSSVAELGIACERLERLLGTKPRVHGAGA